MQLRKAFQHFKIIVIHFFFSMEKWLAFMQYLIEILDTFLLFYCNNFCLQP